MTDDMNLLSVLHQFQLEGYLCDATLISCDGTEFAAHAVVLAAASPELAKELARCESGRYRIEKSMSDDDIQTFISDIYCGRHSFFSHISQPLIADPKMEKVISDLDHLDREDLFECSKTPSAIMMTNEQKLNLADDVQDIHAYIETQMLGARSSEDTQCNNIGDQDNKLIYHQIIVDDDSEHYGSDDIKIELTKSELNRYKHAGEQNYTCKKRGKVFKQKKRLISHRKTHTGERKKCRHDEKTFASTRYLEKHEHTHATDRPHECQQCGKSFIEEYLLRRHEQVHVSLTQSADGCEIPLRKTQSALANNKSHVTCQQCGEYFRNNYSLKRHVSTSHCNKELYKCQKCFKLFGCESDLKEHEKNHFLLIPCGKCNKSFDGKRDMNNHRKTHIGEQCDHCARIFTSPADVGKHVRMHGKPHKCNTCSASFGWSYQLRRHELVHTDLTSCKCPQCGKGFRSERHLKNHQVIHNEEKKYICSTCGHAFHNEANLKRHETIHTGIRPFVCAQCGKSCRLASLLKIHERIHTGLKPFKCNYCDKRAFTKSKLVIHERTHTGAKPYLCSYCGKQFGCLSTRQVHERIHTGEKPYVCNQCGKAFTKSGNMKVHQQTHARKETSTLAITSHPDSCVK